MGLFGRSHEEKYKLPSSTDTAEAWTELAKRGFADGFVAEQSMMKLAGSTGLFNFTDVPHDVFDYWQYKRR